MPRAKGGGGATATAGGLVFHVEPDGVFQAWDAKNGAVLWQFQTGEAGLPGGAGPGGGSAIVYESGGQEYVALTVNRAGVGVQARRNRCAAARAGPHRPRRSPGADRSSETSAITLGTVSNFNIASANKQVTWADDYGLSPTRVRTKAGTVVTFKNSSKKPHTIAARDGSWSTGVIQPGASAARR